MSGLFDAFPPPERSVYGVVARAAAADPGTSHDAAQRMNESGRTERNARKVLALLFRCPGSTAVELHAAQDQTGDLDRHEVSRRLPDLERAGLARRGPVRICAIAGSKQTTWHPTERGQHGG